MISPDEAHAALEKAYVPEHIVHLMTLLSGGEPFLLDGHPCFVGEGWAIVVGYPLEGAFTPPRLAELLQRVCARFNPGSLWVIAPQAAAVCGTCIERESDRYYTLELKGFETRRRLAALVARASRALEVERGREITAQHEELIAELLERERPARRVRALFLGMARYTARSDSAVVLSARDARGELAAFYVVELAARAFATYVVGGHSKKHYVAGASDLLFAAMIELAREHGKSYIHLGLGVNEGIRAFKTKWGGVPSLPYEMTALRCAPPQIPETLASRL